MGSKKKSSKLPSVADPFPYTQPEVYYDPQAGMYYALTGNNQRTTNFSMIPILNQMAMKNATADGAPSLTEMFSLVNQPADIQSFLAANPAQGSSGAGRFLGLLGNNTSTTK